jgi:tetratricopeptide (TPR) repeat protein
MVAVLISAGAAVGLGWERWWGPLARARRAYARGDLPLAALEARHALKQHAGDLEALRIRARVAARLGDHVYAREIFDHIGRERLQAEDYFLVGAGLLVEGRAGVARTAFEKAHERDPRHAETLYELGRLDAGADHLADGIARAEQLVKIPGWEVRGLFMLGLLRDRQAEPAAAAAALERALQLDPKLTGVHTTGAEARKLIARAHLKQGRHAAALPLLEAVLAAGPDAEATWLLSRAALQRGDRSAALTALGRAGHFGKDQPQAFEPAPFVGEAKCLDCHRDIHRIALGSRHAKTYVPATSLARLDLPAGTMVDPRNTNVVHALERHGSHVAQVTRVGDRTYQALVSFAVGSGDRGLTPVGRDESGQYRELRLSYYGDIHGWDQTTGHTNLPRTPDEYLGAPLNADLVRACLGCHTTNYRAALDLAGPEAQDRGIGCERCHGPAGNHLAAEAFKLPDPAIGRPRLASPEQVIRLCGDCHGPRGRLARDDDPSAPRFQELTFPRSRCYTQTNKGMSCVTCHNPHADASTAPDYYEARCLTCHGPEHAPPGPLSRHAPALPAAARRAMCPVNPREKCLECHMPAVRATVPHTVFTDHHIRVHREQTAAN